jgi:3-mercaptopyruvate sulfurtransferase SseA
VVKADPNASADRKAQVTALHAERDKLQRIVSAEFVANDAHKEEIARLKVEVYDAEQRAEKAEAEAARLRAALEATLHDDAKYPQLRLPEMQRTRLEAALASSGTVLDRPKNG